MLWSVFDQAAKQISMELKQHYRVEGLEDVRVIRDRQTSTPQNFPTQLAAKLTVIQDNLVNLAFFDSRHCRRHNRLWSATIHYYISMGTAPLPEVTRLLRFA